MINRSKVGRKSETQEFEVKEWEGSVLIKKLSVSDFQSIMEYTEEKNKDKENKNQIKGMIISLILGLEDDENKPLFTYSDIDDLEAESFNVILKIYTAVMAFNALDTEKKSEI